VAQEACSVASSLSALGEFRPLLVVSRFCHWRWTPLLERVCILLRDEGVPVLQVGECQPGDAGAGLVVEHGPGIGRINLPTEVNWRRDPARFLLNRRRFFLELAKIIHQVKPRAMIFENCDLAGVAYRISKIWPELPLVYWASELSCRRVQAPYRRHERLVAPRLTGLVMNNEERIRVWLDRIGVVVPAISLPNTEVRLPAGQVFSRRPLRELFSELNPKVEVILVYNGIVSHKQAVLDVVASLSQCPERVGFAFSKGVGEPKYLGRIERTVKALGLSRRVVQLDWVRFDHLAEVNASADVGVALLRVNDLNTRYAASSKLYRYLCVGLPVMVSSKSSMADFVEKHRVGVSCDPDSVSDIARAIRRLADDSTRRRLSANAVEAFNRDLCLEAEWERCGRRLVKWVGEGPRCSREYARRLIEVAEEGRRP